MPSVQPFFIVGCPRSGTTMLRDILRLHPNLACPEETHFYRQCWPFGSNEYWNFFKKSPTFLKHRQMDRISEKKFDRIYLAASSRREFVTRYMKVFVKTNKPDARRWFDKSPQNIYGLALIAQDFPRAKFIHIVRNPVDVVSSLKEGKQMKATVLAACNYLTEAAKIIAGLQPALGDRLFEIRYEDFCAEPQDALRRIFEFLREPVILLDGLPVREKSYAANPVLTPEEISQVQDLCGKRARHYHYVLEPAAAADPSQLLT